ncbi:MAG: zf-HC2 domain-containing protein [Gemmataceae bacterium]
MSEITREQLHAYLDDALSDAELARVEQALREDKAVQEQLRQAMAERDRGEHSLGSVWRHERFTCPNRERLNSYLQGVLDDAEQDYLAFHLETLQCRACLANLDDLRKVKQEPLPEAEKRKKRIYRSTAGSLRNARESS